jgi:hypothetical protein
MGNLFKKSKSAVKNYVGSVKGDANAIGSQLKNKLGSKEALSNTFDQRISDGLSDLLTGATGIRTSNIPEISDKAMKAKSKNREARAKVLNGAMTRAGDNPPTGVKLKFPESFLREDGQADELTNYIHFRSKSRRMSEPGEEVYDIFLYIPDNLNDTLQVEYEDAERGLLEALVGKLTGQDLGLDGGDLKQIMIENAPGSSVIKKAAGKTVNPMKFQILKGVNLRTYSYDFMLRPKSEKEANTIREMVYAFRVSALPGVSGENDRVYTFPNEWAIRFHGPFKDFIDYPLISVCTGVDIDYTGGQAFQALSDGAPAAISLKLSFTETSALNRKKYNAGVSAFTGMGNNSREDYQDKPTEAEKNFKKDADAIRADMEAKKAAEEAKKVEANNG